MEKKFSYKRSEKLKGRKAIAEIFIRNKTISAGPFRAFYNSPAQNTGAGVKAGVGVSSKNFKKATDRNRIKRLMREAYRNNKQALYDVCMEGLPGGLTVFFLFTGKEIPELTFTASKMKILINKLADELGAFKIVATTPIP